MTSVHSVHAVMDNSPALTYTAGASTVVFWGLHLSDIAVILSALATIFGVALQFYVAMHRIRVLERGAVVQERRTDAVESRTGDVANAVQKVKSEVALDIHTQT